MSKKESNPPPAVTFSKASEAIDTLGRTVSEELIKSGDNMRKRIRNAFNAFKSIGAKEMKKKHFDMLGMEVEDAVTGFKGVATSISYDLYGCIQFVVSPKIDKDGKPGESKWFDVSRLKVTSFKTVMEVPNFDEGPVADGKKGGYEKPMQC